MSAIPVAYCHLRLDGQGAEIELVYRDGRRESVRVEVPRGDAPDLHRLMTRSLQAGLNEIRNMLGVRDLADVQLAFSAPENLARAAEAELAHLDPTELLTPAMAEAVCFFDQLSENLAQTARRWVERGTKDPRLLAGGPVGVAELREALARLEERTMTVAVVGTMKAGKSTFLNALLGQFVMPALDKRCTRRQFVLKSPPPGHPRQVEVYRLQDGHRVVDPDLSLDVDQLGWRTSHLRSYLFALNAPWLTSAAGGSLDPLEAQLIDDFRQLPFPSAAERDRVEAALRERGHSIDRIVIVHPLHGLQEAVSGNVEIWDTPGPDAMREEGQVTDLGVWHSDRESFEDAVRRSSALLLIFDVMRRESESQEEVLEEIRRLRGDRTHSVLLIANKVDQRPVRNVEPLEALLATIREEVHRRHRLRLRPVLPVAAKPAQLARELLRSDPHDPEHGELLQEYESIERPSDRREDPDLPARAVEARSGISRVEHLLGRFFRQEHGLSILHNTLEKTAAVVSGCQAQTSLELASLQAEADTLQAAVADLQRGTAALEKTIAAALQEYRATQAEDLRHYERVLRETRDHCKDVMTDFWELSFGKASSLSKQRVNELLPEALQRIDPYLSEARETLRHLFEEAVQRGAETFWELVEEELFQIQERVRRQLDIPDEDRRLQVRFDVELAVDGKPDVRSTTITHRDNAQVKKGATEGAAIGLATGIGTALAILSGPIGWGLLAIPAAMTAVGAGVGAAAGYATSETRTEEVVYKSSVLDAFTKFADTAFARMIEDSRKVATSTQETASAQITERAQRQLRRLAEILAEAQASASDPGRHERIERLAREVAELGAELSELEDMALRLGLRLYHRVVRAAAA